MRPQSFLNKAQVFRRLSPLIPAWKRGTETEDFAVGGIFLGKRFQCWKVLKSWENWKYFLHPGGERSTASRICGMSSRAEDVNVCGIIAKKLNYDFRWKDPDTHLPPLPVLWFLAAVAGLQTSSLMVCVWTHKRFQKNLNIMKKFVGFCRLFRHSSFLIWFCRTLLNVLITFIHF